RLAAVVALVLAAAAVFALPLGRRPLYNQDEGRYALLAREATDHGRWILPRVRDEVYLNKPPLFFWSVALLSLPAGGVSDATAPLPSVVSALAGLLAVFAIGRFLWGWRVGFVAALVIATTPFYFFMAHQVLTDMMLTAWLTWALYFSLKAAAPGAGLRPLVAFYLCVAGGLSTKGPAALMVLGAAIVATAVLDGRAGLRRLRLPLGVAILVLSMLPWLVPYVLQTEKSYTQAVLLTDYLGWYFRSKPDSHAAALMGHLARFLPWTLLLVPAVWWWWRAPDTLRNRLLVWVAALSVAVGFSGEQRARYFLPVFPLLALLVAEFLVRAPAEPSGRGRRLATGLLALFVVACVTGSALLLGGFGETALRSDLVFLPSAGWERWVTACLVVVGSAAAFLALRRTGSGFRAAVWLGVTLAAVLAVEGVGYPARYARRYDVRGFAERVQQHRPNGAALVAYPDATLAFDFYLRRQIREMPRTEEVLAFLRAAPGAELITREERWSTLQGGISPAWRPVAAATLGGRRMVLIGVEP
ncbi:MAG: glycosyltransferase family 39 protein, partial [Candidatus Rokubacteria bacterium]|nr:glycosyltransferase family 39 protein [Candidatus Rokubacteria bacterium]